jgi:tetratricopeptide (TPR) repeat protein
VQSRAETLRQLHLQFEAFGDDGGACIVNGFAGSGKTFLAERFLEDLPKGMPCLKGRGLQSGVAPFLPICDAISSFQAGENVDRLRTLVEEYAGALPFLKTAFAPILRAKSRTEHTRASVREVVPSEAYTFAALTHLFESLAGSHRLVLFLDDLQWLDAATLGFLGYLAAAAKKPQIFLLLTKRVNGSEDPHVWSLLEALRRELGSHILEVSLGDLTPDEQLRVVGSILGPVDLTRHDLRWLETCSEGKPYYLRELVELLRDDGRLVRVGGTWKLQCETDVPIVPPTLWRNIRARIVRVLDGDELAHEAVRFGACAGTVFDAQLIADALGEPARRIGAILGSIERSTGLIQREGRTTTFRFNHDLTRGAVLEEIGDFAPEMHRKLASVLASKIDPPTEQIAYQYCAAGDHQAAGDWYLRGSDRAAGVSFFDVAQRCAELADRELDRAKLPIDSTERIRSAASIGRALVGGELYEDATRFLETRLQGLRAERTPELHHLLGRAMARLADASKHRAAVVHMRTAIDALPPGIDNELRAATLTDLVYAYDALGDRPASQASFREAVRIAAAAGLSAAQVRLKRLTCIFWQPEKVVEAIEEALTIAKREHLPYEAALCENNLGSARFALGDLVRAKEHYERSDAGLKKLGEYRRDAPLNNIGLVHLAEGRFEQAREFFSTARALCLDAHSRLFIGSNLAVVDAFTDRLAGAIESLESLVRTADAAGDPFYRDCLRHNLANALLEAGRPEEAISVATACPTHLSTSDELLVEGKRALLLTRAHEAAGQVIPAEITEMVARLDRTTKPQAWLYRRPWYYCDIEFWED